MGTALDVWWRWSWLPHIGYGFFETKNLYKSGNLISIKFGGPNLGRSLKHQMLLWFVGWCFTCAGDWDSEAIIYRCLHASRKRNPSLLTVSSTFINRQPTSTDPNAQATSLQKCTIIWIDFLVPWKSNSNQHPEVFVTGQYQYYRSTSWLLIGVFATVTSFGTFCHYCMIRASHFWPLRQYFPPHHSAGTEITRGSREALGFPLRNGTPGEVESSSDGSCIFGEVFLTQNKEWKNMLYKAFEDCEDKQSNYVNTWTASNFARAC